MNTFVVVHNDFFGLRVAFTGQQYVRTRIFEHRHQKWQHVTLSVKIFNRLENSGTLPFPAGQFLLVIISVTLPERNVAVLKAANRLVRGR